MKKHGEKSGFLPSPSCFFSTHTSFHFHKFVFCQYGNLLVWSRACCAVVNKLSTLFDFAVHCKTRDFNISLDELFIQVFKGNL